MPTDTIVGNIWCKPLLFQYSIGDAQVLTQLFDWAKQHFQYSIGDADEYARRMNAARSDVILSILHWRCRVLPASVANSANDVSFNTPLEMHKSPFRW